MSHISKKLAALRKQKGLTQEEVAEQSNVNLRTIQRIEQGTNIPREKTLHLICDALQVELKDLVPNQSPLKQNRVGTKIVNGLFLIAWNLVLMGIFGYLTLDSQANLNSRFGALLLSVFIHLTIVHYSKEMNGLDRMLRFGFGYIAYFIIVMVIHGFPLGFGTGLFPCLLISLTLLYFGPLSYRKME